MAKVTKKDAPEKPAKPLTMRAMQEQLQRVNVELALAEASYMKQLFGSLHLSEAGPGNLAIGDADEASWVQLSSGGALTFDKTLAETRRDPAIMRRQAYKFWRLQPHARGILRNFQRFIIGRELGLDFADEQHGRWSEDKRKLQVTQDQDDPLAVRLAWDDFVMRDGFVQRAKELVLRTFRDGEGFLRRFERNGRVRTRFIEPEWVATPTSVTNTVVQDTDVDAEDPDQQELVGKKTVVTDGIEHLEEDVETVIAYHVRRSGSATVHERVLAKDVIHTKALADSNDVRGIPLLEVVARRLTNYDQWEEYRMVLNKARTAIWLVRRIEGTAAQAATMLAGRASPRPHPQRLEPVTTSGRREAMPQPGTILNPSAGVKYEYLSPNLDARDASEDGRRFLLSIAAGTGLPEMLVTGDWSNANFASSVEARTPAVREWEDWQDFFEPHFKTIYRWVVEAGKRGLGLPPETSTDLTIQWPSLIAKDNAKETERNVNLNAGGILSRTTWAAREDLIYEDELDNMRMEAELEVAHAGTEPDDEGEEPPAPTPGPTLEAQLRAATAGLRALSEQIDSTIEDPTMRTALKRYVRVATAMVRSPMGRLQQTRRMRRWRMGHAASR